MQTLIVREREPGILEVRLNRPERLNALNPALILDLIEVFTGLQNDRQTRVVILGGEGAGFCAGADLQASASPGSIPGTEGMGMLGFVYKYQELLGQMILAVHECDKPVIAALNGAAVGGGLGLALACDIRVASTAAKFGASAIRMGLSAADVGTSYFLPRLAGAGIAAELMLTGRIVPADEARELRLVSRVVAPDALMEACLALARSIAENAEYGVWMTKKTLRTSIDAPSLRVAMEMENRTQVLGTFTGNTASAMAAFMEKRPPAWKPL
jgi:enoyl-CoA hydratase